MNRFILIIITVIFFSCKKNDKREFENFLLSISTQIENHLTKIEELSKEQGEKFDRNDLTDELVYCINLLKTVEPIHYANKRYKIQNLG